MAYKGMGNILFFIMVVFTTILLYATNAYSQNNKFPKTSYCIENKLGWRFYCDDEEKEDEELQEIKQTQQDSQFKYTQKTENFQKQLEEARSKAIWDPTEKNVEAYMIIQMQAMNQAGLFSDVWRRVVWANPQLDYTQKRPVSNLGKEVWASDREQRVISTLKNINERYGIFFIYSSTCQYCVKYSQILDDLRKFYKLEIKGVSIDGKFLPNWEQDSFVNTGQLEKLSIDYKTVPVTVLYDNEQQTVIPIGYGLMTHDEIMDRIYVLTQTKLGEDY